MIIIIKTAYCQSACLLVCIIQTYMFIYHFPGAIQTKCNRVFSVPKRKHTISKTHTISSNHRHTHSRSQTGNDWIRLDT